MVLLIKLILTLDVSSVTDNAGLCGISGLPTCRRRLSTGSQIGLIIVAFLLIAAGVYWLCKKYPINNWLRNKMQKVIGVQKNEGKNFFIVILGISAQQIGMVLSPLTTLLLCNRNTKMLIMEVIIAYLPISRTQFFPRCTNVKALWYCC